MQLHFDFEEPKSSERSYYLHSEEYEGLVDADFNHCPECGALCDIHTSKHGIEDYICPKCGNRRIRYVKSNLRLFRLSPLEEFLLLWQNTWGNKTEFKQYVADI